MALAPNTIRAYEDHWMRFVRWCECRAVDPLPATPVAIARYVRGLAGTAAAAATIQLVLTAIAHHHRAAGYSPPQTREPAYSVIRSVLKLRAAGGRGPKSALTEEKLLVVLGALPSDLAGIRDRALLLVGFTGGFRSSELVSLNVEDIRFLEEGLVIRLRRSKTDQEGIGREISIPVGTREETCPARTLQTWLSASGVRSGALFRRIAPLNERLPAGSISRIVQSRMECAGLDSTGYASHSLRAGLATSAAMAGASFAAIMQRTGHKTPGGVAEYVRPEGVSDIQCGACGHLLVWAKIRIECRNPACLLGSVRLPLRQI